MIPVQLLFDSIANLYDYFVYDMTEYEFPPVSKLYMKTYKKVLYTIKKDLLMELAGYNGSLSTIKKLHLLHSESVFNYDICLRLAAANGHLPIIEYFYEKGITGDEDIILECASRLNHMDIVKYLCQKNIISDNLDILCPITDETSLDIVKYLHEQGADIVALDNEPVCNSIYNKSIDILRYLHENGADITARNNEPIRRAVEVGNLNAIKYLHENGVSLTPDGDNLILIPTSETYVEYLSGRYKIDITNAERVRLDIVKYLHENGLDITVHGNIVLRRAIMQKDEELIDYLSEFCINDVEDAKEDEE